MSTETSGKPQTASTAADTSPQNYRKNFETLKTTREFRWYVGHVATALLGSLYLLLRLFSSATYPTYVYRLTFLAASIAFVFVVSPKYGTSQVSVSKVVVDEDVQYLLLAFVWIFSTERYLAPVPYVIYSTFHAVTYTKSYLLPALHAHPRESVIRNINTFVHKFQQPLAHVAANVELLLLVRILFAALRLRRGSGIQFLLYALFFRYRFGVSKLLRSTIHSWEVRIDNALPVGAPKDIWLKIKEVLGAVPGPQIKPTE